MERDSRQVAFYHTSVWVKARAAFLDTRNHVCERCGGPAYIVHHKRYITPENVDDPSVTLSFDNLEALCLACHNAEHFGASSTAKGLAFDGNGNLIVV